MRLNDAPVLDYIDEEYAWAQVEPEKLEEEQGLEEELGTGLTGEYDYGAYDALDGDGGGEYEDEDDPLALLDAALAELEEENRAEARRIATPEDDVAELDPTWDRLYQEGAQNFICADRITYAPLGPVRARGQNVVTRDRSLGELLSTSLNRARMALDQRRTGCSEQLGR